MVHYRLAIFWNHLLQGKYIYIFTESKKGLFVPDFISSQSPIVYVKIGSIDWLEISPGQILITCSQRDMY